ncbi:PREDICTED: CAP-Gly domain-containing linker protein 1 isoform X2 [Nicrophorus vespilloides]|uniref:CAP-Gly domain-containing linker protein 1 isoform X2 n=1 Tax=Nicrophorus vespilloides TaxID=110193 RepID=A0ABM1MFD2_NICVS|nr:PREDICTED: CAP-Gly domain-containing linker protein 1 isoform X2 [Nicrophorus vespilloides]
MANESNLTKISDLEFQLEEFKIRTEGLSSSLAELTEELTKRNEENASMRDLLEHANEKRTLLEGEESKSIELVQSLQIKLEESNELLKKQQGESLKELETLNTRLTRQLSEQEVATFKYNKDMEDAKIKYETDVGARDEEIKSLKQELGETGGSLEKVVKELELFKFETQANEASLRKELDRCRMEISGKVLEIETLSEGLKAKDEEVVGGEGKFRKLQEEFEKMKKASRDVEDELRAEIQTSKETLLLKDSELKQLLESKLGLEQSKDEIQSNNLRRLKETEDELKVVKANLEGKLGELERSIGRVKDLELDVSEKEKVKVDLEAKLKEFEGRFSQEMEASKSKIDELELSIGDYQRKLQQSESKVEEIVKLKLGLEEEIKKLYGSTGEDSARLEALNAQVREKEASLEKTRDDFNVKLQETQHCLQQKEIELQSVVEKSRKEMEIVDGKLKELQEKLRIGEAQVGGVNEEKVKLLADLQEVEKRLKDKDEQFEKVLGDLKTLESEKESIVRSGKGESEKLSSEIGNLQKAIEESQVKIKHFEGENVDLAVKLVQSTAELQEAKKAFEESTANLTELLKKEQEVSAKKDVQLLELTETQRKELDSLKRDFETELLESRNNLEKTLGADQSKLARIKELESQLDLTKNDVNSNLVTMETKQQEIVKLASDLQEATRLVDGLKREKDESLVAKQKAETEVANRMHVLTESAKQSTADLEVLKSERNSYVQILSALRLTERQRNELSATLGGGDRNDLLKMVTVEKDESLEWQKRLKEVTEALEKTTRQNAQAQNDISNLQNQLSNQQQQDQNRRIELPQQTDASLLQEKLFAESQVEFLNSIIVDMQKKNEEQKARLEILELGYSPADADELKILEVKKIPPRMYCDICEVFDRHETDDCPQQGNDELPSFSKPHKLRETGPSRPFCEICEVFGHMTEDCQEDQTF